MPTPPRLTVATDGSCLGNPGPGGWAWAESSTRWAAGAHANTTNNLMELRAVYEALRHLPPDQPLLIQADSQYTINALTKWIHGWRRRGWQTAGRKPVKNQAAIVSIDELLTGRDVRWEYVPGHAGHPLNEFVDLRARAAATAVRDGGPVDCGPLGPSDASASAS